MEYQNLLIKTGIQALKEKLKDLFQKSFKLRIQLRLIPITLVIGIGSFFAHIIYKYNPESYDIISMHPVSNSSNLEIEAKIQNQNYRLEIDTGSSFTFSIFPNSLKRLKKEQLSPLKFSDLHGNIYEVGKFKLKQIKIGKLAFNDCEIKEESIDFVSKFAFAKPKEEPSSRVVEKINMNRGRIGNQALRGLSGCWFRFPQNELFMVLDIDKFQQALGYPLTGYVETDFEFWDNLIVLNVVTDQGPKKFMLDTGCTGTMLHQKDENTPLHSIIETKIFKIGNSDLGPQELYQFNIHDRFPFDGTIGMDFLKKRSIFIDYEKNKLYIGPDESPWELKIF